MKEKLIYVFFVCGMALLVSGWTIIGPWKEYVSLEGKFKILIPGDLAEKINEIETPIGKLTYHTYLYQPIEKDPDNQLYMVSYCIYPEHTVHSDSLELVNDFFDTTIQTAVESVEGVLKYSSEISQLTYPGRIWRVDYNGGRVLIKTKSYLVGNRYYSVQTITKTEKKFNPSSDKFLDSFHLIE